VVRVDVDVEAVVAVRHPRHVHRLAAEARAVGVTPANRHSLRLASTRRVTRNRRRARQCGVHARCVHHAERRLLPDSLRTAARADRLNGVSRVALEVEVAVSGMPDELPCVACDRAATLEGDLLVDVLGGWAGDRTRLQDQRARTCVPAGCRKAEIVDRPERNVSRGKGLQVREELVARSGIQPLCERNDPQQSQDCGRECDGAVPNEHDLRLHLLGTCRWSGFHKASALHESDSTENPYGLLRNIVEEMAIAAGDPIPTTYVVSDPSPNAFAAGRDPEHAAVTITSGLLSTMNRAELTGVVAHEVGHIKNRDIGVTSLAVLTVEAIAVLADLAVRIGSLAALSGDRRTSKDGGARAAIVIGRFSSLWCCT